MTRARSRLNARLLSVSIKRLPVWWSRALEGSSRTNSRAGVHQGPGHGYPLKNSATSCFMTLRTQNRAASTTMSNTSGSMTQMSGRLKSDVKR